jgi:hypothetical protein
MQVDAEQDWKSEIATGVHNVLFPMHLILNSHYIQGVYNKTLWFYRIYSK